jgi:hypothetical protein
MRRYLNILSAALLMVYGTLTFVIVPLHHHANENNISSKQLPSALSQWAGIMTVGISADDCDVCTFASTSVLVQPSIHSFSTVVESGSIVVLSPKLSSRDFSSSAFLRGPPENFS